MAKTITLTWGDAEYTLEFNRETVKHLEKMGFETAKLRSQPVNMLPMLFDGAFLVHHRRLDKKIIDQIYSKIKDKDKLLEALLELYAEPVNSLFDEPEDDEGNVEWGKNF